MDLTESDIEAVADLTAEHLLREVYDNGRVLEPVAITKWIREQFEFSLGYSLLVVKNLCNRYENELTEMGYRVIKYNNKPELLIAREAERLKSFQRS